jgi:hypothetical protein
MTAPDTLPLVMAVLSTYAQMRSAGFDEAQALTATAEHVANTVNTHTGQDKPPAWWPLDS